MASVQRLKAPMPANMFQVQLGPAPGVAGPDSCCERAGATEKLVQASLAEEEVTLAQVLSDHAEQDGARCSGSSGWEDVSCRRRGAMRPKRWRC